MSTFIGANRGLTAEQFKTAHALAARVKTSISVGTSPTHKHAVKAATAKWTSTARVALIEEEVAAAWSGKCRGLQSDNRGRHPKCSRTDSTEEPSSRCPLGLPRRRPLGSSICLDKS